MNNLKALVRMDRKTGAICVLVLLVAVAMDALMFGPTAFAQSGRKTQTRDPNCPHYQYLLRRAAADGGSTSTNCIPNPSA